MSDESKLQVIIVGSGLAGLTAARILRENHHVTVYERGDAAIATGGQGIIIAPNGVKILESIGYNRDRAGAVPIYGIRTYDKEGNVNKDVDMDLKPRFGADCLAQKRSDFRDELMRLATTPSADLGIKGNPAEIVFNNAVVGLDPEEGVVTLSDGSTAAADVVIVSIEDAKKALGDLPLPHWWEPSTCQNQSTKSTTESWHADGDRAKMVEDFGDFHEPLKIILRAATEVKVWELQDLEPLLTWTQGRAMLIGDVAHAMTLMQGQGANMSIEDAESLRLLAPGTRREDVQDILKLAETVRRPRIAQIQAETRKSHSTFGVAERVTRNLEFNCGYNGIHDALKAQQEKAKA
ncbi:putative 6-hydroxynicotinate 3-monooxygenase [Glonium stellatum]|uniref:Putative 6-hydroxynicotinate 3-monooxygenase n=1 Tax=Glonium stellatum TaxID=574774 RepID=A0A8E2JMV8_9PEZI|nr:putative 6-hydroxynicotinate 3-monooxygenase [Glonium stellatum]